MEQDQQKGKKRKTKITRSKTSNDVQFDEVKEADIIVNVNSEQDGMDQDGSQHHGQLDLNASQRKLVGFKFKTIDTQNMGNFHDDQQDGNQEFQQEEGVRYQDDAENQQKQNSPDGNIVFDTSGPHFDDPNNIAQQYEEISYSERLKLRFRYFGSCLSLANLIGQILFLMKQEFSSRSLYDAYQAILLLKLLLTLIVSIAIFIRKWLCLKFDIISQAQQNDCVDELRAKTLFYRRGLILYLCYPLMLNLGFYRILSSYFFKITLIFGYFIEMFLQLIPIAIIQSSNNENLRIKEKNTLQTLSLTFTVLMIFEILIQLVLILMDIRIQKIRERELQYQSTPFNLEERKRKATAKKIAFVATAFFIIFVVSLAVGDAVLKGRTCEKGQGIYNQICMDCKDKYCDKCEIHDTCDKCQLGFFVQKNYCQRCDESGFCKQCDENQQCFECDEGSRLLNGQCVKCGGQEGCAHCEYGTCTDCLEGYYMDQKSKACVKCSDAISNCQVCKDKYQCTQCTPGMTTLNNGTCQCTGGWQFDQNTQDCSCSEYNLLDTNECKSCIQAIPNCQRCTEITSYIYGHVAFKLDDSKRYLRCEDCGGDTNYLDTEDMTCKSCDNLSAGCETCNKYGYGCTSCENGYFLKILTAQNAGQCRKCNDYIENCSFCNKEDSCSQCESGYQQKYDGTCILNSL